MTTFCGIKGESSHVLTPYSTLKTVGRSPVFSQAAILGTRPLQEQIALLLEDGIKAAYAGISSWVGGLGTSTQGKA